MNRIAIDIDEVLMPFVKPMANWRGHKMPRTRGYSYIYKDMFNISEYESKKMVKEFYESKVFQEIQPFDGAYEGVAKLRKQSTKIYAVTGRQNPVREKTEDWLNLHFPDMFDDLVMTNSFTECEIGKLDVCRSLNLDTLIDDNEYNCLSCAFGGMSVVHFAGVDGVLYPWCSYRDFSVLGWEIINRDQ